MTTTHPVTKKDMMLLSDALKYTTPANVPLRFCLGGRVYRGIPDEFQPKVSYRMLTCNTVQYVIEGQNDEGLEIRAECIAYRRVVSAKQSRKRGRRTPKGAVLKTSPLNISKMFHLFPKANNADKGTIYHFTYGKNRGKIESP